MSKITAIATSVPAFKHSQKTLFEFANTVYSSNADDTRKLQFLYNHSGIDTRYSIIPDFDLATKQRIFFTNDKHVQPEPSIEIRMQLYENNAAKISADTIEKCITDKINAKQITHLITVSCTGMSAPGLDLQIMEMMNLPNNISRTSVNFMGCYAAIHAMKIGDAFCNNDKNANVIIVCTEFCTLHFQAAPTIDNITSSLLFADGCAAILIQHNEAGKGLRIDNFYSDVNFAGKKEMAWQLSSNGFLMTLTGYVPALIKADFEKLVSNALKNSNRKKEHVTQWCIHPGGKKIVDSIADALKMDRATFVNSYEVLKDYGNMSSPTILFVLQKILQQIEKRRAKKQVIFGAAFGPGLTMETFTATYD